MEKLTIKNYKCFDEEGVCLPTFKAINIIIGKNNSGKSSIIDVVKHLMAGSDTTFFSLKRNNKVPKLSFNYKITEDKVKSIFRDDLWFDYNGQTYRAIDFALLFVNKVVEFEIGTQLRNLVSIESFEGQIHPRIQQQISEYIAHINTPFFNKTFTHLTAERDIQPETINTPFKILPNGVGATHYVQEILNKTNYESYIIEKRLLKELNKITNPDMYFTRILVQQNEDNAWEINLEDENGVRVPLSKMGSGLKTIILVLLLIWVVPSISDRSISDFVFALEELENNLHPSQQRRLYNYLNEFRREKNCTFFFTTHSNIIIDLFFNSEDTQILHINKDSKNAQIKAISQYNELNNILDDLDIKASDILQSNSIIWVEGPSDRTYIKKWISLIDSDLIEGYHYTVMFYGGRLLSNVTLEHNSFDEELIPLIKLNRHCVVVMDRDGKNSDVQINSTKQRIAEEIGESNVWVTKGREIENYISDDVLSKWLKINHEYEGRVVATENDKLETILINVPRIKYSLHKNKYANEIINHIEISDLDFMDLRANISKVVDLIRKWNKC